MTDSLKRIPHNITEVSALFLDIPKLIKKTLDFLSMHIYSYCKDEKRGEWMSPKTGRPKSDNPRNIDLNIRLTKDEAALIKECADKLSTTRTDVVVKGIRMVKSEIDKEK